MQQESEPSPSRRPSDEEIQDCLDIMTRTNKKAMHSKAKPSSQEFMLTLIAYGRALAWLEEHDISFEYDSKQRRYIAKKEDS